MAQSPELTVISKEIFSGKAWRRYTGYAFAAGETLIPLVVAELAQAVPAMPLGFVQSGKGFQLVAVTSLQPGGNLFVAPDGRWLGAYVPAALRGYPFRLVKPQDRADSVLCIDEASGLVVEGGQGETFFDEDGRPSKALRDALENEAFLTLRRSGALPVAYARLLSMNRLSVLQQLTQIQAKLKAPTPSVVKNLTGLKGFGLSQDDGTLKFH